MLSLCIFISCLPGTISRLKVFVKAGYHDSMMTPEQLRAKYPQLRQLSDEELIQVDETLHALARLLLEWWEEKEKRSNK